MVDGEGPGFDVKVGTIVALQASRMIRCGIESEIGKIGHFTLILRKQGGILGIRGLEGYAKGIAFETGVEIVILRGTMINAEARTNHGFAVKHFRGPGHADTRVEVFVGWIVEHGISGTGRGIDGHRKRSILRARTQAGPVELIEIEDGSPVIGLARDTVIFPTETKVEGQVWIDLPFVLKIGKVKCAAILVTAPRRVVGELTKLSVDEISVGGTGTIGEVDGVVCSFALVEANPADFHAGFEGVSAMDPGQIVDDAVGGADFVIRIVVVEGSPVIETDGKREDAGLRIDKRSAIDENFGLVKDTGSKSVLKCDEIISGMIDGTDLIEDPVGAVDQTDVALGAAVERGAVVDFVVDAHQPGVFVDDCWLSECDLLGIRRLA